MAGRSDDEIRCSFCGKSQGQVRKLIAGPKGAYICDECVDICAEIIEEEFENEEEAGTAEETEQINLLKPEELKAFLDDYVIGQDQAKKVLSVADKMIKYVHVVPETEESAESDTATCQQDEKMVE